MLVSAAPFLGFLLGLRHGAGLVGVFSALFRYALPFQRAEDEVRAVVLLKVLGCARDLVPSAGEIALGVSQGPFFVALNSIPGAEDGAGRTPTSKEEKGPYFDCRTLKDEWDEAYGNCKKME
jgi:hypothetical protein